MADLSDIEDSLSELKESVSESKESIDEIKDALGLGDIPYGGLTDINSKIDDLDSKIDDLERTLLSFSHEPTSLFWIYSLLGMILFAVLIILAVLGKH